jgi:hypothetical protein
MDGRSVVLMFVCVGAALYLRIMWLAGLLVIVLLLAAFGSIKRSKPRVVAVPSGGQRETIYPVIYEDVGAPYLYHPKLTRIKIAPEWEPYSLYEQAGYGMGNIVKTGIGLMTGWSKGHVPSKGK